MHVFSSYIEHELVINKSSEDFLHACLGACVYVVYLVLLRSPAASNDIDRDPVHQKARFRILECLTDSLYSCRTLLSVCFKLDDAIEKTCYTPSACSPASQYWRCCWSLNGLGRMRFLAA
jgi:hypothetical protein